VARAKRTDRADARRRYRQAVATGELEEDIPAAARPTRSSAPNTRSGPSSSAPPARPGVFASMRAAIQPADVRGDLRALPDIALRSKALIVPVGLAIAAGGLFYYLGDTSNIIAVLAFQALVVPPPLASSFLGGLLAPRASWLVGGLVGLACSVVFAVVALLYPDSTVAGTTAGGVTPEQARDAIIFSFAVSPTLGLAVGAFAGFYRRFLRSASPNPPRRTSKPSGRR
jgi:hypothetical protein